jgi:hypothetical protein
VGNSGSSDTGILRVYCGATAGNLLEQTPTQSAPIPLTAGSIARATINYNWTAGTTYYFKIISSTGQPLEWPEQAPTS